MFGTAGESEVRRIHSSKNSNNSPISHKYNTTGVGSPPRARNVVATISLHGSSPRSPFRCKVSWEGPPPVPVPGSPSGGPIATIAVFRLSYGPPGGPPEFAFPLHSTADISFVRYKKIRSGSSVCSSNSIIKLDVRGTGVKYKAKTDGESNAVVRNGVKDDSESKMLKGSKSLLAEENRKDRGKGSDVTDGVGMNGDVNCNVVGDGDGGDCGGGSTTNGDNSNEVAKAEEELLAKEDMSSNKKDTDASPSTSLKDSGCDDLSLSMPKKNNSTGKGKKSPSSSWYKYVWRFDLNSGALRHAKSYTFRVEHSDPTGRFLSKAVESIPVAVPPRDVCSLTRAEQDVRSKNSELLDRLRNCTELSENGDSRSSSSFQDINSQDDINIRKTPSSSTSSRRRRKKYHTDPQRRLSSRQKALLAQRRATSSASRTTLSAKYMRRPENASLHEMMMRTTGSRLRGLNRRSTDRRKVSSSATKGRESEEYNSDVSQMRRRNRNLLASLAKVRTSTRTK
eukprot:g2735.t1